jgi:hypothetical protein
METKISENISYSLDEKTTELTNRLWFIDGFAEQGDLECSLIITESNNLLDNWKGIIIDLSTSELIRLKNAINSHLELVTNWRENHKTGLSE